MTGWALQETGTTCRERCGGQGYLSCNRFGQIIGFAHAGMTAEGDNRVLMMKVSKEYLATLHLATTRSRLQAGTRHSIISGMHLYPRTHPLSLCFRT
jgi:acyl-CoA oxidase